MNVDELCFASATEIARLVRRGEISACEVTEVFLTRIAQLDPSLNCFIRVTADDALSQARQVDETLSRGGALVLAGVPVGIKDIVDVAGVPTTNGAHQLFHTIPATDAPVVRRLRRQGAVIVGKTNLHEFAYGVTNKNPHFGPTRNPWDHTRIPGGSSGGSAAAVAAGLCAAAIGTDTGGSIRIPASLCGTVGIKPTYDRVPRSGITPLAWTLDHVGPMTRTVQDANLLLQVMAAADGADVGDQGWPVPHDGAESLSGLRVGVPRPFFWDALDGEVRAGIEEALHTLEALRAEIVDVEVPNASAAGDAVAVIMAVEAAAVHEHRLRTHPEAYGEDVRVRLESGLFLSGVDYVQAQRARTVFRRALLQVLDRVHVLVVPTTAVAAPTIEEQSLPGPRGMVPVRLSLTRLTNPFNLTGVPALSIPCGATSQQLPIGLQIVGRPFDEPSVLRVARAFEAATGWTQRRPELNRAGA